MLGGKIVQEADTKEFENVLNAVDNLTGDDAKGFLKIIYANFDIYENGNYTSDQLIKEVSSIYSQKILRAVELRNAKKKEPSNRVNE